MASKEEEEVKEEMEGMAQSEPIKNPKYYIHLRTMHDEALTI